jgi:hypothetical protein
MDCQLPYDDVLDLLAEETPVDYLSGSCQAGWRGSGMFFRGDQADLEKSVGKLQEKHAAECTCGKNPWIGVM